MRLQFLGGTETVTGSMHLIEANGCRAIRDVGLFQGRRVESNERNRERSADPDTIQHVILSHAHIDHCGRLPWWVAQGYKGPIHATSPTAALTPIMLRDSAHIQESDAEYLNQKANRKGEPPVVPLYTKADAERAIRLLKPHEYHTRIELAPGFAFTHLDAGHILGSALTVFELSEGGRTARVGYAVDLGRFNLPLIRDPEYMEPVDVLVMESTYGNRRHDDAAHAEEQLLGITKRTLERGGKVLIPSFALERAQEIVYHLNSLIINGRLPRVPIYLDSPMANAVTEVFNKSREYLDEESRRLYASLGCLTCPDWVFPSISVNDSKAITASNKPCIVIAASGMCEHGRILHHLKHGIENERNSVVLVGYQASYTLGRRLQEGETKVRIFGDWFTRRAEVAKLEAFSAHADVDDLARYAQKAKPSKIYLVHGESEQREALAERLRSEGHANVFLPKKGDEVIL
ncbi:MAG: MBL fold metallo-hydrolase [Kiritimatiellae bacterium]|nr:MBL fold metallo-hydrolase [Kiritimatiellia bacterium]MCO5062576.1 MBL fold metallo-hydrolase [Kiritimatiellia bacterium]MCO6399994.1 MBL fold metallo-hydrolase [Verrucomicrobiota bacterium]